MQGLLRIKSSISYWRKEGWSSCHFASE